jgi:hypothetical protein
MLRSASHCKNSPVPVGRIGRHRLRLSSLPLGETSQHILRGYRLLTHTCGCRLHPHDYATVIVDQIVVVVPQSGRSAAFGCVRGIGISGRNLVLFNAPAPPPDSVLPLPADSVAGCDELAASANCSRGTRLSFAAFASMKLPSTDTCLPCTSPTSTHCRTICSNNCSNNFDS